jgi:hypothetical protein
MKPKEQELPEEWINLIKEAMKSNITKEDFKKFLEEEKKKRNLDD